MRIRELKQPIDNKIFIDYVKRGIIKLDSPMVLWMETGTAWLSPILIQGVVGDDLIEAIDWIYDNDITGNILELYNSNEVLNDDYMSEYYLPINGGEYYTNMISQVEFIDN